MIKEIKDSFEIQEVLWVESKIDSDENQMFVREINSIENKYLLFLTFKSVEELIDYIKNKKFKHYRLICSGMLMKSLLQQINNLKLIEKFSLIFTLKVFCKDFFVYQKQYHQYPLKIYCSDYCSQKQVQCISFTNKYDDVKQYILQENLVYKTISNFYKNYNILDNLLSKQNMFKYENNQIQSNNEQNTSINNLQNNENQILTRNQNQNPNKIENLNLDNDERLQLPINNNINIQKVENVKQGTKQLQCESQLNYISDQNDNKKFENPENLEFLSTNDLNTLTDEIEITPQNNNNKQYELDYLCTFSQNYLSCNQLEEIQENFMEEIQIFINDQIPQLGILLQKPKKLCQLENTLILITCFMKFGKDSQMSEQQIYDMLRHVQVSSACLRQIYLDKYLMRLLTKEYFYNAINNALINSDAKVLCYLRYIISSYFKIFQSKNLPCYDGIVYRGIQVNQQTINELNSLVGKQIFFKTFLMASTLRDEIYQGNVLFEIETIGSEIMKAKNITCNPYKYDVVFMPLDIFCIESVREDNGVHIFRIKQTGLVQLKQIYNIDN